MKITNKKLKPIENLEEEIARIKDIKEDLMGENGLIKRLVKQTVEVMLEGEMINHLVYSKNDNIGDNSGNSRNGYSSKTLRSGEGKIEVSIPRDRNSEFDPVIVKKYNRGLNDGFDAKIISMYGFGMSNADINHHLDEMYGLEISDSEISNITDQIIPEIEEWKTRPLATTYLVIYIDGIWFNVKENGKIVNKCEYNMLGIDTMGHKEILGIWMSDNETASTWSRFLTDIKGRGVKDILIACMDGLPGLASAVQAVFPNTIIQNCVVHQIRNTLKYIKSEKRKEFTRDLRSVYGAINEETALNALGAIEEKYPEYVHALKSWRTNWDNLTTYFDFPYEIRKIIYTTNAIESFHSQIRKVTKTKRVFTTSQSLEKLIYLVMERIQKKWTMPIANFGQILTQFQIFFEGRC